MIYKLSPEADNDIEDIFDDTEYECDLQKAIAYTSQFHTAFTHLAHSPELGKTRGEIKAGLRSLIQNKHVVFYRILNNHIRIVRVLHSHSDMPRFLENS